MKKLFFIFRCQFFSKCYRYSLFLFSLIILSPDLLAQNLAPNPDFELYSICPTAMGQLNAISWSNAPIVATPDYFNACNSGSVGVPSNGFGFQNSQTGGAYIGIFTHTNGGPPANFRENVQAELNEPLVAGCYELKLVYSFADNMSFSDGLGILLSNGIPATLLGQIPQLEVTTIIQDHVNWLTETSTFVSTGGETHISIGNFRDDVSSTFIAQANNSQIAYTYIDFVEVKYIGPTCIPCDADAGAITVFNSPACPSETISMNILDYNATTSFEQYILVTDIDGFIIDFMVGNSYDYSYDYCGIFTIYSYNIEIGGGSTIPSIGSNISDYDCNTNCCKLTTIDIIFEDDISPYFTVVPEHPNFPGGGPFIPIVCIDDIGPMSSAMYDDNCMFPGSVEGIEIDNTNFCNGGTIIRQWEISDSCSAIPTIEEQIITIGPIPTASFINPPMNITVDCGEVPTMSIDLSYSNDLNNSCAINGIVSPVLIKDYGACGGTATFTWSTIDECNRSIEYIQTIFVNESAPPSYVTLPDDITVDCSNIPTSAADIEITNGLIGICEISEMVTPTLTNNYNGCNGEIIVEWNYTDMCNRNFIQQQVITITEVPIATFIDPPITVTTTCVDFGLIPTTLNYSNNSIGDCDISGSVEAILDGSYDGCGGNVSYLWEYTDECGRTINYTQDIIVTPAVEPVFISIPEDITLDCGVSTYVPPPLEYTNSEFGSCLIEGFVNGTAVKIDNQIIVDWTLDLPCSNNFLTATQIVTLEESPEIFLTPQDVHICEGDSYDLQDIEVIDINTTGGNISYHFATPPSVINELASSTVSPLTSTEYFVLMTTDEGCIDYQTFDLIIDTIDIIAEEGTGIVCNDNSINNLLDFLISVNDPDGIWIDLDDTGIALSNASMVSFNGISAGEYMFGYTTSSTSSCLPDTALLTIDVVETVELLISNVMCTHDLDYYSVAFSVSSTSDITTDFGLLSDLGDGDYIVDNIPIENAITLLALDEVTFCSSEIVVSPPDCSCPPIDPPIINGDKVVCIEGLPIELTVSVGIDQSANWYTSAIGGTVLESETLSYMHVNTLPGIYTYYLETVDMINIGCVSSIKTAIVLTILESPIVMDTSIRVCQDYQTDSTIFILSSANMLISSNSSHSIIYYETEESAINNFHPLDDLFIITDGMNRIVYARIEDSFGCLAFAKLELVVLLPPEVNYSIVDETCIGENNGLLNIIPISDYFESSSIDQGVYLDLLFYEDLIIGPHLLSVKDSFQCINEFSFEIDQGIELSIIEFIQTCYDNETNSISDDDTIKISFSIATTDSNVNFELIIDGLSYGVYPYEQVIELQYPADSLIHNFIFIDVISGCELSYESDVFLPCSTPCDVLPNATIYVDPNSILDCYVQSVEVSCTSEFNVKYNWYVEGRSVLAERIFIDEGSEVILIATDTISGCVSSDTLIIVDLEAYPIVELMIYDTLTCEKEEIVIDGSMSQSGSNLVYKWSTDGQRVVILSDENSIPVFSGGWYYLEVIDTVIGCSNIDSVFVVDHISSLQITLPIKLDFVSNTDNIIMALVNIDSTLIESIKWNPSNNLSCKNCLSTMILSEGEDIYTIEVIDIYGCVSLASISIIYDLENEITPPNIFSPNGDGYNDYFIISVPTGLELEQMSMKVYDRWGELLYNNDNLKDAIESDFWDGTYKGQAVQPGVYVFLLEAIVSGNGKDIRIVGDLTVLR